MNKILQHFLVLLSISVSIAAQISNEGLQAHYPFDGNANDFSDNDLNGEVIGAQLTTDRLGNLNSAYYFDGVDDYINLGNSQKLKPQPPFSIAFWACYYDSGTSAAFFVSDYDELNYYGTRVHITRDDFLTFQICNGGSIGPYSRKNEDVLLDTPPAYQWFHVAATIDASLNMTVYINGNKISSTPDGYGSTLVYSENDAVFGKLASNANLPFYLHGKLDDFYMFDRTLTDEEIETLALDNSSDHSLNYTISIDTFPVIKTYDVIVPVNLKIPEGEAFSSFQFSVSGFTEYAEFVSIINDEQTILSDDWLISANTQNDTLIIAGSSSNNYDSSGVLLKFKIQLFDTATAKTIPLDISNALFDNNTTPALTSSGSIIVMNPNAFTYGDVDYNDVIRPYDAALILKYLVGKIEFSQPQALAADVSLDSTVSAYDASLILDYITRRIPSLPYESEEDSLPSQNFVFSMPDVSANSNDEIILPIYFKSSAEIASLEGELDYDKNLLSFYSIQTAGALSEFDNIDYNFDNGKLKFAACGTRTSVEDSLLLYVVFYNTTGQDISADVTLSKIKINEEETIKDAAGSHLVTAINNEDEIPAVYSLSQNYPNPFNPATEIIYSIPENGFVTLNVYNILGQLVETLVNETKSAGKYSVTFNASKLSSGIYLYRISSGNYLETKKMMLIK